MSEVDKFTNEDNGNFNRVDVLLDIAVTIMQLLILIKEHSSQVEGIDLTGISVSGVDEILKGKTSSLLIGSLKKLELMQIASLRIISEEFDKLYNEPKFSKIKDNEEFVEEFINVVTEIYEQLSDGNDTHDEDTENYEDE